MWLESQLVADRINSRIATEATLFKSAVMTAVAAVFSKDGGRAASDAFAETLKEFTGDGT